jgi:hypothetical protein
MAAAGFDREFTEMPFATFRRHARSQTGGQDVHKNNSTGDCEMALVTSKRLRMAAIVGGSMIAGGLMTGTALAYQGHMFNALHSLQVAFTQLQEATPDKGGYRVQAMGLVQQAISAVNSGIAAGS